MSSTEKLEVAQVIAKVCDKWLTIALSIIGGLVAVRVVFDINRWMEQRRKRQWERLRSLCPHVDIVLTNGDREIHSYFTKPAMTELYKCSKCGKETDGITAQQISQAWADPSNYAEYERRVEKFIKQAKKMGLL